MLGKTIFWFVLSALVFLFSQIFIYSLFLALISGASLSETALGIMEIFAFGFVFTGLVGIPTTILIAALSGFLFAQYTSIWFMAVNKIFGRFIKIGSVFSATFYPVLVLNLILSIFEQRHSFLAFHSYNIASLIAIIVSVFISAKILENTLGNFYNTTF